MTTPTTSPRQDVAAYVAGVRAQLDDLSVEEVEELAGGLEADLGDLAAESDDDLTARIGPPAGYAAELRAAAGLPPRRTTDGSGSLREQLQGSWANSVEALHAAPWWDGVAEFLTVLRPVWWVARALIAFAALRLLLGFPIGLVAIVPLAVMVVISVELGRGRWSRARWLPPLVTLGNVLAVVLALVLLSGSFSGYSQDINYEGASVSPPGLSQNGQPVTNVYAYDAQGQPIPRVQLFDQDGRPLAIDPAAVPVESSSSSQPDGSWLERAPVAATDVYGRQLWNVFPLRVQEQRYAGDGSGPTPVGVPTGAPVPQVSVPPLAPVPTTAPGATSPSGPSSSGPSAR